MGASDKLSNYNPDWYLTPGLDPANTELEQKAVEWMNTFSQAGGLSLLVEPGEVEEALDSGIDPSGFVKSFWSALGPEFIGRRPSEEVERYRRNHPAGSFISQFAGVAAPFSIPFVGQGTLGIRLAARLPGLARAVRFAELAERPIAAAAVKEAVRFAPLELARIAGSTVAGDEGSFKRTIERAALDIPIFAGFGAAGGLIRGARPFPRDYVGTEALIQEVIPEYDFSASAQEKLRHLIAFREGSEEAAQAKIGDTVNKTINELKRIVRRQENPYRSAYVQELEFGGPGRESAAAQALGRRFALGRDAASWVRSLTVGRFGYKSRAEVDDVIKQAGLPPDFEAYSMYVRIAEALTDTGGKGLRATLLKNTQRIDHQWRIAKQKEGLYVMVKRLRGRTMPESAGIGEAKVGRTGDKFLILQTDNPGIFATEAQRFAEVLNKNAFRTAVVMENNMLKKFIPAAQELDELNRIIPSTENLVGLPRGKRAQAIRDRLGTEGQQTMEELHGLGRFFSKWLKEFSAPALFQFSDSARAVSIYQKARTLYSNAVARTAVEFYGKEGLPKSSTLWGQIIERRERFPSIESAIAELTPRGLGEVSEAFIGNMSISEARAAGFGDDAITLLTRLDRMDRKKVEEVKALFEYIGEEEFIPMLNHYMVSRTWRGKYRLPIRDSKHNLVAVASGRVRSEAVAEAEAIVKAVDEPLIIDHAKLAVQGRDQDLGLAMRVKFDLETGQKILRARQDFLKTYTPSRFTERRKGIAGFQETFTKKEIGDIVFTNILETNKMSADRIVRHGLAEDMSRLYSEYPVLHRQLVERVNRMSGQASEFDRRVTAFADRVLAPFIGPNAPSRIVRATNRALFSLTLGHGDFGFVALNALTPVQTAMPEVAFLLTVPPERLAHYYSHALVLGSKGPRSVAHLSPLKVMRQAIKDMSNPSDELRAAFTLAQERQVTAPRFIEAFVGQSSEAVSSFKKVLAGEQGFVDYILRLSEFGPAKSEELSRGFAFVMGHNVGRDFFDLEGKKLFKFAEEFVGRTMYNYGTGDRAKVITGSIGTLFGLFKNWSMHYIANFMVYSGEGFLRGNWKPLLWQSAGTFGIAGAGAIPGYGIANSLSKLFTDESLMENMYQLFGYAEPVAGQFATERVSDAFFYGLPGLFGATLQGRAAPPGAELIRDVNMLFSMAMWDRAVFASRAISDSIDYYEATGNHPINSQKIRDEYIRAFAPRTLYRAIQTSSGNAIRSLSTGNMLLSNVSIPERVAFVLGLTPTEIDKAFFINDELFKEQSKMRERVSIFGSAVAEARARSDWPEVFRLHRDAFLEGIPVDSVERSAGSFETRLTYPLIERQFDEAKIRALRHSIHVGR